MNAEDPWNLLRAGEIESGLRQMRFDWKSNPTPSHSMSLGIGYLWTRQYEAAWKHFSAAIDEYPNKMASFYGMAGTTKWCLDQPSEAVRQWTVGLDSQFTDAAGGVQLPLLLLYASIISSKLYSTEDAKILLNSKLGGSRSPKWPGPLAKYVLGQINNEVAIGLCSEAHQGKSKLCHWIVNFYSGALDLSEGRTELFQEKMQSTIEAPLKEPFDNRFFLSCLWREEFFLARHQLSSDPTDSRGE